ncbi:MAG TPA: hypothetical protein VH092_18475 [Urbifossiella sp.]|jgi:hypothetical protein|nr:hypothetical protein [Urbifossiella sp.]
MPPRFVYPAAAAVLIAAGPAFGLVIASRPVAQRAVTADVVVVGTVTAVEDKLIETTPAPGVPNKVTYKLAVVKVDQSLAGADALTHLKVGFFPPPPPPPVAEPGRPVPLIRRRPGPELKAGEQYLLFLTRHHEGSFYLMPFASPAVDLKTENGKTELADAKKALAAVADPKKALAADNAADRAFAATVLVGKYRTYPDTGGDVTETPLPADESRLILRGLADGDWKQAGRLGMNPMTAFHQLGLTPQDGWTPPQPQRPVPGQPPVDFAATTKAAFVAWLDGPGKDYRVKRVVAKK